MKKQKKKNQHRKINVGIMIDKSELGEMLAASRIDLNGPAVLSMARKGLAAEKAEKSAANKGGSSK